MKQKNTPAIQQAASSKLGPNEEFAWTRSDGAPEIDNALEACGGKHFPSPPHPPNANLIECVILTFGEQRMTFAQSGCAPYWRPIVAISAAQQWSIHRQTVRTDVDGKEVVRTPMHWRLSNKYQPVTQHNAYYVANSLR